jgi:hypothetical protein
MPFGRTAAPPLPPPRSSPRQEYFEEEQRYAISNATSGAPAAAAPPPTPPAGERGTPRGGGAAGAAGAGAAAGASSFAGSAAGMGAGAGPRPEVVEPDQIVEEPERSGGSASGGGSAAPPGDEVATRTGEWEALKRSKFFRVRILDARSKLTKLETRIPANFIGSLATMVPQVRRAAAGGGGAGRGHAAAASLSLQRPFHPPPLLRRRQIAGINLDEMLRGALGRDVDFKEEPLVDYEVPSSGDRVQVWLE